MNICVIVTNPYLHIIPLPGLSFYASALIGVLGVLKITKSTRYERSTGGRQLPTAAITISQHGGRRSRYKIIFTVHAIIKHQFLVLGICIHRNNMYAFIEHCHLNDISKLLLLDDEEENGGLMVIYKTVCW